MKGPDFKTEGACLYVTLPAELDHPASDCIRRETDRIMERLYIRTIVFDFSETTFMDSSGIALILRAQQRMGLLDGSLLVRSVPQQARRVLDAAGIGRLVTIQ